MLLGRGSSLCKQTSNTFLAVVLVLILHLLLLSYFLDPLSTMRVDICLDCFFFLVLLFFWARRMSARLRVHTSVDFGNSRFYLINLGLSESPEFLSNARSHQLVKFDHTLDSLGSNLLQRVLDALDREVERRLKLIWSDTMDLVQYSGEGRILSDDLLV